MHESVAIAAFSFPFPVFLLSQMDVVENQFGTWEFLIFRLGQLSFKV